MIKASKWDLRTAIDHEWDISWSDADRVWLFVEPAPTGGRTEARTFWFSAPALRALLPEALGHWEDPSRAVLEWVLYLNQLIPADSSSLGEVLDRRVLAVSPNVFGDGYEQHQVLVRLSADREVYGDDGFLVTQKAGDKVWIDCQPPPERI